MLVFQYNFNEPWLQRPKLLERPEQRYVQLDIKVWSLRPMPLNYPVPFVSFDRPHSKMQFSFRSLRQKASKRPLKR